MIFGKGQNKSVNNLEQEALNVSEVQNPDNYNQSQYLGQDSSIDPSIQPDSQYEQMLANMQEQYGQSPEQMEDIMNRIAYHETGPSQRMQSDAIQQVGIGTNMDGTTEMGDGTGRGLFQFESGPKGSATGGGATAMGYMRQYHNKYHPGQEMPEWMDYDPKQGVDASKLTPEQQKMMFMANTTMSGPRSFEGLNTGNLGDWWQKNHYAGDVDKTGLFGKSMVAYNREYSPVDSTMDSYNKTEDVFSQGR